MGLVNKIKKSCGHSEDVLSVDCDPDTCTLPECNEVPRNILTITPEMCQMLRGFVAKSRNYVTRAEIIDVEGGLRITWKAEPSDEDMKEVIVWFEKQVTAKHDGGGKFGSLGDPSYAEKEAKAFKEWKRKHIERGSKK